MTHNSLDDNTLVLTGERQEETGNKFRFRVTHSPAGTSEYVPKTVDIDDLKKEYGLIKDEEALKNYGHRLGEILFGEGDDTEKRLDTSYQKVKDTGILRIVLQFDAALHAVPWEFAHVNFHGGNLIWLGFLSLDKRIVIVRELLYKGSPTPWHTPAPALNVLALVCNPRDQDYRSFDEASVFNGVEKAVNDHNSHGAPRIDLHKARNIEELKALLADDRTYQLAYVFCHGIYDEQTRQGALALTDKHSWVQLCESDFFATLIQHKVNSIVFCSCHTGEGSPDIVWSSVGNTMLAAGASVVIAMNDRLTVGHALEYTGLLFEELFEKAHTFEEAMASIRWRIQEKKSLFFGVPVLYEHHTSFGRGLGITRNGRKPGDGGGERENYHRSREKLIEILIRFLRVEKKLCSRLQGQFDCANESENGLIELLQTDLEKSASQLLTMYRQTHQPGEKKILKAFIVKFLPLCVERTMFEKFMTRTTVLRFKSEQKINIEILENMVAGQMSRDVSFEVHEHKDAVPRYLVNLHPDSPSPKDMLKKWDTYIRERYRRGSGNKLENELKAMYNQGTPLFMLFKDDAAADSFAIDHILKFVHNENNVNDTEELLAIYTRDLVVEISK